VEGSNVQRRTNTDAAQISHPSYDRAAAVDAWRVYDADDPDPGYFQFDWLSGRHPDLYHAFALTSDALTSELEGLIDLCGLDVIDVGAGTGRSALGLARTAAHVLAVDAYSSVIAYGEENVRQAGVGNVTYARADRSHLPVADDSVDAVVSCWAELDRIEAERVLKPGGVVVQMGANPFEPGELTPILSVDFPQLVLPGSPDLLTPDRPPADDTLAAADWWGEISLVDNALHVHDFTYTADYGTPEEAAAIFGRLFGPNAQRYLRERRRSTVWSRLRIWYGRIEK
jgi:SAM-dependent methyltransferase